MRVLRYLKGTSTYGLLFDGNQPHVTYEVYTDASFATQHKERKSTTGLMAGACTSWCSSKQACVAVSTAESEIIALSEGIKEGEWVNHMLTEMGFKPSGPVVIWCDNTAAIDIMHNPGNHKASKHVETRYLMGRDLVEKKRIKVLYCKTTEMIADSLT